MLKLIKSGLFDSSLIFKNVNTTPKRTVEYYEIELYLSGEGNSYIDDTEYPHKRGNLIFAKPGQKRYSKNKFICLYVHLDMDEETADLFDTMPPVIKITDFDKYEKIYREIINIYENALYDKPLYAQSKLYELLDIIQNEMKLYSYEFSTSTKILPEIIEKAKIFIENNYTHPISLKDIAQSVRYSPVYFHRAFKECVGMTPHEYLEEKRLEGAKLLLLTSDYSMNDIFEKCGFTSHSYFDYKFKKAYGITPSTFKKRRYTL